MDEVKAGMYELMMGTSQTGTQARRLIRYQKVSNMLVWCNYTNAQFENDKVRVWPSPQGLSVVFPGNSQVFGLIEVEAWEEFMVELESCLPSLWP
jgi:hypothetical protein